MITVDQCMSLITVLKAILDLCKSLFQINILCSCVIFVLTVYLGRLEFIGLTHSSSECSLALTTFSGPKNDLKIDLFCLKVKFQNYRWFQNAVLWPATKWAYECSLSWRFKFSGLFFINQIPWEQKGREEKKYYFSSFFTSS